VNSPDSILEQAKARMSAELTAFLQMLAGVAVLAMVMLGVGGTIFRLVSPDGWLAQIIGRGLGSGAAAVFALAGVGLFAWFTCEWVSSKQRNRFAEAWVYTCAGAGIVYLAQLWLQGTL